MGHKKRKITISYLLSEQNVQVLPELLRSHQKTILTADYPVFNSSVIGSPSV